MTTPSPAGRIGSAPAERWPLTVLGRVLAPAGVRLLTVGGPHPDPLDPRPDPDRRAADGAHGVELTWPCDPSWC